MDNGIGTVHELAVAVSVNMDNLARRGFMYVATKWDEQTAIIQATLQEIAERTAA